MHRRLLWLIAAVALVATIAAARWLGVGSLLARGSSGLEQWCGQQVQRIANDLLRPRLSIGRFDFVAPRTLVLDDVRLVDGDVTCLEASRMELTLRDIPRRGRPIVIDTIALTAPVLRLVVRDDGSLAGFTGIVKSTKGRTFEDGGSTRPSDVFAMRTMTVSNGSFVWRNAEGGTMQLDDLDFDLAGKPAAQPGRYDLKADLDRAPVLEMHLAGWFDLDEAMLDLADFAVTISLDDRSRQALPPSIQAFLQEHAVRGQLHATGKATIPLKDAEQFALDTDVQLTQAHYRTPFIEIPVDSLGVQVVFANNALRAEDIDAKVFGGALTGRASLELGGQRLAKAKLSADGLHLERAFPSAGSAPPPLQGTLSFDATASMPLPTGGLPPSATAEATVHLKEARYARGSVQVPVKALSLHAALADGGVRADGIDAQVFDGRVQGTASVELSGDHQAHAQLTATGLRIERALAAVAAGTDVSGAVSFSATIATPLAKIATATGDADVHVVKARYAHGQVHVPVEDLTLHVALADGAVRADGIDAQMYGGRVRGKASLELSGAFQTHAQLSATGLRLERALAAASVKTDLAGAVTADATIATPLATLPANLDGSGTISIDDGRLMNDPVFGGIMREREPHPANLHDRAAGEFRLTPDYFALEHVRLVAGVLGARGSGRMQYDGNIDFLFNAGPIERLENETGPLGELAGLLTDRVLTYEVAGTWSAPKFTIHPLGIGAGDQRRP